MNEDGCGKDASVAISTDPAAKGPHLHLPVTTDPPGPQNPPKQVTWVVKLTLNILE